jgi:hypothetical protein
MLQRYPLTAWGEQQMIKFDRHSLVFGLYLLVLVAIAQYIADYFKFPIWPAYMCMIFFFVDQMDAKKAPHIVVGGVAGIAAILLFAPVIGFLAPYIGVEASKIALILALVYAIVAFNLSLPLVFNSYAFMFLTVSGLALETPGANPYQWMLVAALGGALLIGGVMVIGKIIGPPAAHAIAEL